MILKTIPVESVREKYNEVQKNRYFFLSLTFATISIFLIFAIRPTVVQAIEAYKNLKQLQELEIKLAEKEINLEKAEVLINENKDQIELLKKAIPSEPNESVLLGNLNESAYRNQVILDGISFISTTPANNTNPSISTDNYKILDFSASFDSKYTDFQNFIKELNNYLRIVQITSISIEQNASLNGARIKGKISGRIFYR